jgi:hypothetical protein
MDPFFTFTILTAAVTGAVFYRMRGGAPSWPRPIEQILFCIVFAVCMAALSVPFGWQVLAFTVAVVACLTGHGQYFFKPESRVPNLEAIEPERVDFLLRALFGRDPRTDEKYAKWREFDFMYDLEEYGMTVENWRVAMTEIEDDIDEYGHRRLFWRSVAGLSLTGGIVSLAPGLAIILTTPHIWAGLAIALSGFISKGAAYLISHALGKGTEGGEYGNGALQWGLAVLAALLALGRL